MKIMSSKTDTDTYAFDFDGVIHKYSKGWLDGSIYDEPNMEIVEVIRCMLKDNMCNVIIISTRDAYQIVDWINDSALFPCELIDSHVEFWNKTNIVGVTNRKLPAQLYIDDRAYRYDPDAQKGLSIYDMLSVFKSYANR